MGRIVSIAFVTVVASFSFAYTPKEGNITALFGPFFSKTNFQESRATDNKFNLGVGLVAVGDFNNHSSLEIAIFHMNKQYYRLLTPSLVGERAELMHITMGYRRWLSSKFSFSAAVFSSYSIGSAVTIYNDVPPGATDIDTSARDITEYGMDLAFHTELYEAKDWTLALDTRYSFGLTSKEHESADHYGAMIGIKYLVQEKYPGSQPSDSIHQPSTQGVQPSVR